MDAYQDELDSMRAWEQAEEYGRMLAALEHLYQRAEAEPGAAASLKLQILLRYLRALKLMFWSREIGLEDASMRSRNAEQRVEKILEMREVLDDNQQATAWEKIGGCALIFERSGDAVRFLGNAVFHHERIHAKIAALNARTLLVDALRRSEMFGRALDVANENYRLAREQSAVAPWYLLSTAANVGQTMLSLGLKRQARAYLAEACDVARERFPGIQEELETYLEQCQD